MSTPISSMVVYVVTGEKDIVAVFSTRKSAKDFIEEMIYTYGFDRRDFVITRCTVDRKFYI